MDLGKHSENITKSNYTVITNGIIEGCKILQIIIFLLLTVLNLVVNIKVISLVITMPGRMQTAGNVLVAHMSVLTVLLNLFPGLSVIFHLDNTTVLCVGHSILRNVFVSVLPLNVMAINYERLKVFRQNYQGETLLVWRGLFFIWIVAALGNLPSVLTVKFVITTGTCKRILILDSTLLTTGFEVFKLAVYTFIPMGYIFYSLFQIRCKVGKYLFSTQIHTVKTKLKVAKIRLVVLNGILFTVLWTPFILLLTYQKISSRTPLTNMTKSETQWITILIYVVLTILGLLYFILNPVINLHLNVDLTDIRWYSCTYQKDVQNGKLSASITQVGRTSPSHENNLIINQDEGIFAIPQIIISMDNEDNGSSVRFMNSDAPVIKKRENQSKTPSKQNIGSNQSNYDSESGHEKAHENREVLI